MDKFLLVANWKANHPKFADLSVPDGVEVAIAAPYSLINTIPSHLTRASQDVSAYPLGAYTGEIPAALLADLGVKYCLVGHSERRKYLAETNFQIEAKIKQAIDAGLVPILCAQNEAEIPENIRNYDPGKFLIMYEPSSAISTQGEYHPESPEKVAAVLADWKERINLRCKFLYGGSVNPDNVQNYRRLVSGFVVGQASLEAKSFSDIIKKCLPD